MTYAAREESRTLGRPIELYLFRFGVEEDAFAAYTDAEEPVVHQSITYQPITIKRGDIGQTGSSENADLEITMSRLAPLAGRFLIFPPSTVVTVTIFSGHVAESEFIRIWGGRVLGVVRTDSKEVGFNCQSRVSAMKRNGLRRKYGPGCPHLLFGPDCRANKAAASVTKTVLSVAGSVLTFAADWESSGNRPKFRGGMAEWISNEALTERRTIVSVGDGDGIVRLNGYATGLDASASVTLIWGCDHTEVGCTIHANLPNYGGQLWLPTENPIGLRNQFA